MNIGAASKVSGVSAKMIRHYEDIGLLKPPVRCHNSYRDYGDRDIHELRFIGRARKLGFSTADISGLLALWRNRRRSSDQVRRIAMVHLTALENRRREMDAMINTLSQLVDSCHGDTRPQCPILVELGECDTAPSAPA